MQAFPYVCFLLLVMAAACAGCVTEGDQPGVQVQDRDRVSQNAGDTGGSDAGIHPAGEYAGLRGSLIASVLP